MAELEENVCVMGHVSECWCMTFVNTGGLQHNTEMNYR